MIDLGGGLDYEDHLRRKRSYILDNNEDDTDFKHQAQDAHARVVIAEVSSIAIVEVWAALGVLSRADAQHYLRYGVLMRLHMLGGSLSIIRSVAPAGRTTPLRSEEAHQISIELNAIYINIVGTIDNIAWVLREELGGPQIRALRPTQVRLDSERFLADENFRGLAEALDPLQVWLAETKKRRNPAAHRIPLSLSPPLYTEAEALAAAEIAQKLSRILERADRDMLLEEAHGIGTFAPFFKHKPDEEQFPIYPTVPQDVGNVVKIVRMGLDCLKATRQRTSENGI